MAKPPKSLFTIHHVGSVILIRFSEDARWIDVGAANQADKDLTALIDDNAGTVVVLNLRTVEMMATLMIGHLVRLHKTLERSEGNLRLCSVGPSVLKTLSIMGLDRQLSISESEAEALSDYGLQPPPFVATPANDEANSPSASEIRKQEGLDTNIVRSEVVTEQAESDQESDSFSDPRHGHPATADLPFIWDEPEDGVISFELDARKILATGLVDQLLQHFKKIAASGEYRQIVLDMSRVQYLSSRFVGQLTNLQKVMGENSGTLVVSHVSPNIRPLFRILKVDQVIEIREDNEAAG